jgi:hypothetical protein
MSDIGQHVSSNSVCDQVCVRTCERSEKTAVGGDPEVAPAHVGVAEGHLRPQGSKAWQGAHG